MVRTEVIDAEMAQRLQNKSILEGDLWIWTVTYGTSDMPGKYAARPHSVRLQGAFGWALVADTLAELRGQLPWGMTQLPRQPEDDPVIVESWI